MIHRFLVFVLLTVGLVWPLGCATETLVREEIQKSETKVERQLGRLETGLGQERARVSGIASQVTEVRSLADGATRRADQAMGGASQALTKAEEAGGKAAEALAKAEETDKRLSRLWATRNKRNPVDSVDIPFGFNKWELDDPAQTSILGLLKQLKENPNLLVNLEGHTDNMGSPAYNIQLSQRRAEAVRRFLVEKGIELDRIHLIGLADARPMGDNKTREGRRQNRRVTVWIIAPAE